ncbi:WD repeat-containing protein l(2)05287 isoform X1 [Megachile rotundata]|uniref:WD repeat-containing protein l(2)05287 isoform X1 n=1 Tax=Megachile rotundata TaxID=143995 RepID=UPI000258F574|nr:PREDICTED: WD repeat-containing protein 75 [Megachile rotundata]
MQMKLNRRRRSSKIEVIDVDDLVLARKGGGSIIDQRPVFSHDGETLYIVWKHVIRAYSTQTGDFVRELEPASHRIAGLIIHPDNPNQIITCTENGELNFWSCQSGIITKKLKLKFQEEPKIKTFHIVNYKTHKGNELRQVLVTYLANNKTEIYIVLFDLENGICTKSTCILTNFPEYYVDIIGNHGDNLIAILHDADLHILNPSRNLTDKLHKTGKTGRIPTCIAGHPEEECVATGDSTGRVVVWRGLFQTRPCTAVYHWHTLPVTEIAFSKSGTHMYTGGGECVLVKWVLANSHQKSFLPRLPAPIKHLTIAPNNLYVAVSTLDNGIVVVNPQRKLTSVIQNFTWGVALSSKDLFPAGLIVDPRTNCLVLNSRTGHVQFYNTHTKSLLYNINITAQNFLTQERSVIIVNTEVTKIALNHDGSWLATVEERNDKTSCIEVRLKFWMFDTKQQLFTLNTSIELPHEGGINALHFQPNIFGEDAAMAVTTGRDKKFKLWQLAEPSSVYKKTKHWQCHSIGDYRNLPVTDAGFSVDGSLVGIGFDSSVTMWTPDTCTFKCSLTHSKYQYPITRIEFGKQEACHLVVTASTQHIAVWNILSLTLIWSVPLKVATLTADPKSTYMAVFTTDNSLYVFTPQKSMPIYTRKDIIEPGNRILGATFVPHLQRKRDLSYGLWQQRSQLFFIDSNQELLTLEPESEVSISLETLSTNASVPATAFSSLIAAQVTTDKETTTPLIHEQLNVLGKGMVNELLSVSAHTLPPMKLLCSSFITSLLLSPATKTQSTDDKNTRNEAQNEADTTDESEEESPRPVKRQSSPVVEDKDTDEMKVQLVDYNWSFLSTILPETILNIDEGKPR